MRLGGVCLVTVSIVSRLDASRPPGHEHANVAVAEHGNLRAGTAFLLEAAFAALPPRLRHGGSARISTGAERAGRPEPLPRSEGRAAGTPPGASLTCSDSGEVAEWLKAAPC
jgi:hypothetical protein